MSSRTSERDDLELRTEVVVDSSSDGDESSADGDDRVEVNHNVVDQRKSLSRESRGESRLRESELKRSVRRRSKVSLNGERNLRNADLATENSKLRNSTDISLGHEILREKILGDRTARIGRLVVEFGRNGVGAFKRDRQKAKKMNEQAETHRVGGREG